MRADFFLKQINKEFPEVSWKTYEHITRGLDHDVIILDGTLVFRFPNSEEYKNKLIDEIALLSYLRNKVNAQIPHYTYTFKQIVAGGYSIVPGNELLVSTFRRMSLDTKKNVALQLASFITSLQRVSVSVIKKFHVMGVVPIEELQILEHEIKKYVFPELSKTEIYSIQEYFDEFRNVLQTPFQHVLSHADLSWEHILWDKTAQQINIIDFSDREYGDTALDFTGLFAYGPKFAKQVYEFSNIPKDDQLLHRSQLYYKRIALWMMKDALQGPTYCSYKEGYDTFKKRFQI